MAIKSQIRLVQVTGSVVDYKPAAVAAGVVAAAFSAGDLSGSFRYMAQALANIHGNVEFGAQTPGLINAADGTNYDLHFRQQDTGQKIHIQSLGTGADAVDIDSSGAVDVDAAGKVQLLGGDDSEFLVADTKTLFLGEGVDDASHTLIAITHDNSTAANEKILVQNKAGTQGDAIRLKAEAGGIWIDADSTNNDAINIDSAGGIDVDSATAMSFTTSDAAGDIAFVTAHTAGVAFHIDADANAGSIVDIDAGALDIDALDGIAIDAADGDVTITADGADNKVSIKGDHANGTAIHIDGNAAATSVVDIDAGALDIDVTAATNIDTVGFDLNAGSGVIELTTTGNADMNFNALALDMTDSSAITITSSEAAEDLVIQQVGGNDSSIIIAAAGTGTDAIKLGASAGGVDVDAAGAFDVQAGTMSLDATGASNLTVTAGADAADLTISMGNDGTPRNSSIILDSAGTGVDAIKLNASAGGIEVSVIDGQGVSIGKAGGVELMLTPHGTPAQEIALLENSGGTKRDAVKVAAAAGGLVMSASSALDLSGSVCFSADAGMDPLNGGSMPFAKRFEFSDFRGKSLFTRSTTVVGALNALADSVASSEPTLFALTLTANINAGSDVTVAKVAGDGTNLLKNVGENKARVYVNGQLMKSSSGGVTNDYVIQDSNDLRFQFQLKTGDVVQVMDFS